MTRKHFRNWSVGLAFSVLAVIPAANAQQAKKSSADISGVWVNLIHSPGFKGKESEWTTQPLPFTPKGRAAFEGNHPGKSPRHSASAEVDNDPIREANPTGLFRTMIYFRPFEIVQTPEKVIQLFGFGKNWRVIYTDGRPVPDDVVAGPYWYGFTVGKWEGDTLVATTLALDERAWMDEWGTPFSADARFEERWRRIAPEKLELVVTVKDPTFYTKPWTTDPLIYTLLHDVNVEEILSAPIDEKEFNEHLRERATGASK